MTKVHLARVGWLRLNMRKRAGDRIMKTVQFARVLAGAKSFKDLGIPNLNDTYRGQVLLGNGQVQAAIIKDIPLRELANEVFAATLCAALSLPAPPALIALASPNDLNARYAIKLGGSPVLFASADVGSPSIAQIVVSQPAPVAALQTLTPGLMASGKLGHCYGFDGWTANTDRHVGNMLIGPNGPWLIDHGRAFTGPAWTSADLDPSKLYRNRLKEWLTPLLAEADQKRLLADVSAMVPILGTLDVNELGTQNSVPDLLGDADFNQLVTFLRDRVSFVTRIAADALNQPRVI